MLHLVVYFLSARQPFPLKAMLSELLFVSSLLIDLHFIVIPDSLAFKLSAFQTLHCILFFFNVLKSSMVLGEQEKFFYSIST